jgi:hypothetical protein
MAPELIVMLTYNDKTVENALELFEETKNLPVKHWGFKDIGLPAKRMGQVANSMRQAGKTTYLEVVSLSEAEGLRGAKLAVDLGFDVLMGTVFFDSINDYLRDKAVKYYPFPGHVHSHPSILDGSIEEIVAHTQYLRSQQVDGMDLLTYRYRGDATRLLGEVVSATELPVVCAGSIASLDRITEVWRTGAWGFTIGTAFFERRFVPDGTFEENVMEVCSFLQRPRRSVMERKGGTRAG